MTHISKRVLSDEVKKNILDSFDAIVGNLKSQNQASVFLATALTETERIMIAKRLVAAFLLRHNIDQNEIAETLKLTPATISKLRLWVKLNQKGFEFVFSQLEKERGKKIAKQILYRLLDYALKASTGNVRKIVNLKT